jgi:hypothetical protein
VEKQEVYRRIKIAGLLSFIPLVMACGPLAGYWLGDFLRRNFGLAYYVSYIAIGIGFLSSFIEVVRIIRLVVKMDKKSWNS